MKVTINNDVRDIADGSSLTDVLLAMGLDPGQKGVAVALNAEVISRSVWAETRVKDGDRVDVIHAVQGG